jgi:NAD(P)-dependent dehydrogenase (short-subunit alcohol dehydrogenase family)
VVGLTKTAALEYAQAGIRINAVYPGFIHTPMVKRAFDLLSRHNPHVATRLAALHPVGRLGPPEEVAAVVVWLCSAAASFVTGHTMTVDGGTSPRNRLKTER